MLNDRKGIKKYGIEAISSEFIKKLFKKLFKFADNVLDTLVKKLNVFGTFFDEFFVTFFKKLPCSLVPLFLSSMMVMHSHVPPIILETLGCAGKLALV